MHTGPLASCFKRGGTNCSRLRHSDLKRCSLSTCSPCALCMQRSGRPVLGSAGLQWPAARGMGRARRLPIPQEAVSGGGGLPCVCPGRGCAGDYHFCKFDESSIVWMHPCASQEHRCQPSAKRPLTPRLGRCWRGKLPGPAAAVVQPLPAPGTAADQLGQHRGVPEPAPAVPGCQQPHRWVRASARRF